MLTTISAMSPAFTAKPTQKEQAQTIELFSTPQYDVYVTPGSNIAQVCDNSRPDDAPMGSLEGLKLVNLEKLITNHLESLKEKAISFLGGKK